MTYLKPRSGYILLALFPVVAYFYIATQIRPDTSLLIVAGLISLIPIGIFVFHLKSYVLIDNEGIIYKDPFKQRMILWKDVSRSYIKMKHTGKSSQRRWYFENQNGRTISFATGMYSKRSLQTIAEALISRGSNIQIDKKIADMAEGRFPWYIF